MAAYTEAELTKLKVADLREIAEDNGFDTDSKHKKADLVTFILENQEIDDDELDDDELDDPIEVGDSDEVDDDASELDDEPELDDELDDEEDEPEPEPEPKKKSTKKVKLQKELTNDGEATLAAKQVAALLKTDPKTLRQFFRSPASTIEAVGSGGRYEFLESDVDQIRNEFAAWMENKTTRKPKTEGGSKRKKEKVIPDEDIAPEIEELDDELDELEDDELEDDFDDELDD